jgi:hypothetical protein
MCALVHGQFFRRRLDRKRESERERERKRDLSATVARELVGRVGDVRNRKKGAAMELDGEHELTHQLLACPSPQSMEVSLVEPFRNLLFSKFPSGFAQDA